MAHKMPLPDAMLLVVLRVRGEEALKIARTRAGGIGIKPSQVTAIGNIDIGLLVGVNQDAASALFVAAATGFAVVSEVGWSHHTPRTEVFIVQAEAGLALTWRLIAENVEGRVVVQDGEVGGIEPE